MIVSSAASDTSTGVSWSPWRRAFSNRLRQRIPTASGSTSEFYGLSGDVQGDAVGAHRAPDVIHDHPDRRSQVGRVVDAQPGAFGAGELQQVVGAARQPLERRFDVGGPLRRGRIVGFGLQPLGLCNRCREGSPELVGGIGGEAAFGLEGGPKAPKERVQGDGDRGNFSRQIIQRYGAEFALVPSLERISETPD